MVATTINTANRLKNISDDSCMAFPPNRRRLSNHARAHNANHARAHNDKAEQRRVSAGARYWVADDLYRHITSRTEPSPLVTTLQCGLSWAVRPVVPAAQPMRAHSRPIRMRWGRGRGRLQRIRCQPLTRVQSSSRHTRLGMSTRAPELCGGCVDCCSHPGAQPRALAGTAGWTTGS